MVVPSYSSHQRVEDPLVKKSHANSTAKPFSSVSVEDEVLFQDVVKYTNEEGYTVSGSVCGSSH